MRRSYLIAALGALGVASFGVASMALGQPFSTPYATAYLKLTGGALTGGVSISGTGTCSGSDSVLYDNNGVIGCPKLTDVAPQSVMIRPPPSFPGGTQTAGNVLVCGGQDESKTAIDGADPSVSCAGDNDTISMTIIDSNGATVSGGAIVVAEDTDWTATASVADTCASLATGVTTKCLVSSVAYCTATCTSPDVRIVIGPNTASMTLAESTAGCTTVTTGTHGTAVIVAPGGTASITNAYHGTLGVGWAAAGSAAHVGFKSGGTNLYTTTTSTGSFFGGVASVTSGGAISANSTIAAAGNLIGSAAAVTRTDVIHFCGNGPNGATTVYLEPLVEAALYADATCDGNDSTTEATSDMVWRPFDFSAVSMECGCVDVAVDTGLTFALRDDTSDASADLTCTTGAGDASGFVTCEDQDTTPPTIAAGSAIAMRIVAASGDFSTADCWCRLTVSQ